MNFPKPWPDTNWLARVTGFRAGKWTKSQIDLIGSWQNYAAFGLEKYIFLPLARRNLPAHISAAPLQPTPVWHICQPVADRVTTYGKHQ
ncbi:hypothetical protein [Hoeflea sp. AS16]|uniref:hypothetical protein n=1 Tax=Hoeflea sp. AS16 TaxID=3135779 RepID=UPI00317480D1